MSAHLENQLLSKVIDTQDFLTLEKLKINDSFFTTDYTKYVYNAVKQHYHHKTTYGTVPSLETINRWIGGNFPYTPSNDTLPTLCSELRKAKMRSQLLRLAENVQLYADSNPVEGFKLIKQASAELSSDHEMTKDLSLSNSYQILLERYQTVVNSKGVTGIPWPWDIMNEETQGLHNGSYYLIFGRMKNMKTWVGLSIGTTAYLARSRVLIWSGEMTTIEIIQRCACLMAKVDYDKFRKGQLNQVDFDRVFGALQYLSQQEAQLSDENGHMPALQASGVDDESSGGISTLHAKIREFRPDIVVVDGVYLMKDDRASSRTPEWVANKNVSRDLKRTAQIFNIPVIGITQANRDAKKMRSHGQEIDLSTVAFTDAAGQDCDLAMYVEKQADSVTGDNELIIRIPGFREGKLDAFVIHGLPAVDFSFKRLHIQTPPKQDQPMAPQPARPQPQFNPKHFK